jgi:hypothetical protein
MVKRRMQSSIDDSIKQLLEEARAWQESGSRASVTARDLMGRLLLCAESAEKLKYLYSARCLRTAAMQISERVGAEPPDGNRASNVADVA